MLQLQKFTPDVYYKQSRDFQYLGRLFDIVLNSCKTEADILHSLPLSQDSPNSLLQLASYTLGLRLKTTHYTDQQLKAVLQIFPFLLKNKGSIKAVELLCVSLLRADNLDGEVGLIYNEANAELVIQLPPDFSATAFLMEVLTYILPAGVSYYITKVAITQEESSTLISISADSVEYTRAGNTSIEQSALADLNNLAYYISNETNRIETETLAPVAGFIQTAQLRDISEEEPEQE